MSAYVRQMDRDGRRLWCAGLLRRLGFRRLAMRIGMGGTLMYWQADSRKGRRIQQLRARRWLEANP